MPTYGQDKHCTKEFGKGAKVQCANLPILRIQVEIFVPVTLQYPLNVFKNTTNVPTLESFYGVSSIKVRWT